MLTDSEYALIEKVYTFHPSISETEGKKQVAYLFVNFGMRIFKDMERSAEVNQNLEAAIKDARRTLLQRLVTADALRRGEVERVRTFWTVYPDDPDMAPQHFITKQEAQNWADGLCCGYYIEHI